MKKAELNPDMVYTHEEFLQVVRMQSRIVDDQVQFKQGIIHHVPYDDPSTKKEGNLPISSKQKGETRF